MGFFRPLFLLIISFLSAAHVMAQSLDWCHYFYCARMMTFDPHVHFTVYCGNGPPARAAEGGISDEKLIINKELVLINSYLRNLWNEELD
jgi:hypothetical protein